MTEKQNVPFDEQVRRTLEALPDAPPPGSTFDAGRLWEQLRPELAQLPSEQVQIQSRWHTSRWWLAAASLAGLILSWFVWFQPQESGITSGLSHNSKPVSKPSAQPVDRPELVSSAVAEPKPAACAQLTSSGAFLAQAAPFRAGGSAAATEYLQHPTFPKREKNQDANALALQATNRQVTPETAPTEPLTAQQPTPSPTEAIAAVPEPTTVAGNQTNKAVSLSKNRWRVVHQNELPALDEAYQVRYRSAQYGRLGTGSQAQTQQTENLPLFSIPLSRKPIQ